MSSEQKFCLPSGWSNWHNGSSLEDDYLRASLLKMGPIDCPETSINNKSTPRDIPEERICQDDSRSASQKILRLLWNLVFHRKGEKKLPLDLCGASWMQFEILGIFFSQMHCSITLLSVFKCPIWFLPLIFRGVNALHAFKAAGKGSVF